MMVIVNATVKKKSNYTTSNMVIIFDDSLFSTKNFVKISLGRYCNHGISALRPLYVIKPTQEKATLLFGAFMLSICVQNSL